MPRMVAILLVAGFLTSACGTTSRQVQPTAADLQTIKRLAVVVTGDDPFRVVAERAEGPGKAAKAAAVGGAVGGVVGGLLGYAIGGRFSSDHPASRRRRTTIHCGASGTPYSARAATTSPRTATTARRSARSCARWRRTPASAWQRDCSTRRRRRNEADAPPRAGRAVCADPDWL